MLQTDGNKHKEELEHLKDSLKLVKEVKYPIVLIPGVYALRIKYRTFERLVKACERGKIPNCTHPKRIHPSL